MTDPDHAWDTHEEEPTPAPVTAATATAEVSGNIVFLWLCDYQHLDLSILI